MSLKVTIARQPAHPIHQIRAVPGIKPEMTSTHILKTSVNTNNSPSQVYTNPDDQPTTNKIFCAEHNL